MKEQYIKNFSKMRTLTATFSIGSILYQWTPPQFFIDRMDLKVKLTVGTAVISQYLQKHFTFFLILLTLKHQPQKTSCPYLT